MLPILRRRYWQVLLAVLCALALSRMPVPMFAEDAISVLVNVEDRAALAVVTTPNVAECVSASVPATLIQHSAARDTPNPLIEYTILRL